MGSIVDKNRHEATATVHGVAFLPLTPSWQAFLMARGDPGHASNWGFDAFA
jgi:hypothetical protein